MSLHFRITGPDHERGQCSCFCVLISTLLCCVCLETNNSTKRLKDINRLKHNVAWTYVPPIFGTKK